MHLLPVIAAWLSIRVQVTNMARQMVVSYGFSDIGPWTLQDQNAQSGDMIMRMMARNTISESLQGKIDTAVRTVIAACCLVPPACTVQ